MKDRLEKAAALVAAGNLPEAEKLYREILSEDPKNPSGYWGLGRVAMRAAKIDVAIKLFEKATSLLPAHPLPLIDLAKAHEALRRFDAAGKYFKQAAEAAPRDSFALYSYGVHLSEAGVFGKAEKTFRAAIALNPAHSFAYYEISKLKKFASSADKDIKAMAALIENPQIDQKALVPCFYAMGKAHDDLGEYDSAFEFYERANKEQHKQASFSVKDMLPFFTEVKNVFDEAYFGGSVVSHKTTPTPIFIVGLPRSGTSLLETILGRHSQVFAAGELPFISRDVVGALSGKTQKPFPHCCAGLGEDDANALARLYIDRIDALDTDAQYVTDKLPANFQSIGLIRKVLPEAKIINLARDPLDVGVSIYRNFFNANEPYFSDLGDIGAYAKIYKSVMDHWRQLQPGFIYDVSYDALVSDPENTVRDILDYCDIEWEDQLLTPTHDNKVVQTLSSHQVRQKINNESIGIWRRYEQHLSPLKEALK